jgi:hypothetical protein
MALDGRCWMCGRPATATDPPQYEQCTHEAQEREAQEERETNRPGCGEVNPYEGGHHGAPCT